MSLELGPIRVERILPTHVRKQYVIDELFSRSFKSVTQDVEGDLGIIYHTLDKRAGFVVSFTQGRMIGNLFLPRHGDDYELFNSLSHDARAESLVDRGMHHFFLEGPIA